MPPAGMTDLVVLRSLTSWRTSWGWESARRAARAHWLDSMRRRRSVTPREEGRAAPAEEEAGAVSSEVRPSRAAALSFFQLRIRCSVRLTGTAGSPSSWWAEELEEDWEEEVPDWGFLADALWALPLPLAEALPLEVPREARKGGRLKCTWWLRLSFCCCCCCCCCGVRVLDAGWEEVLPPRMDPMGPVAGMDRARAKNSWVRLAMVLHRTT
mmetsp:Transcript_19264/g.37473  ORF Transcript_19264/g.37473 Transcript_19264/m.37473 type:complete len:212 (+) Transcript_19264:194-829(+)